MDVDSSKATSADIMQEIAEQTNALETEEQTNEVVEEESTETADQEEQAVEGQREETSADEETETDSKRDEPENVMRIKYKGRDVDIPAEKIREYVQKGYRFEEKLRELKEKEREIAAKAQPETQVDFSKLNEEFVRQLQENPVGTLMQFTRMVNETAERERAQQRKFDRTFEREMASVIPHWDAIKDSYRDYREEGNDHKTAIALAEAEFFKSLYLESKQKGVREGEQKAQMKLKAQIPTGKKRGASSGEGPSEQDLRKMSSQDMAKALGLAFVRHPDW